MENSSINAVKPDVISDNMMTINSFIKESYKQAKKQVENSVSFLKEEFSFMYDKTSSCLNRMVLPVNNFLKDITQIESEFQQELSKESGQFMCLQGKFISVDEVLSQPMEENY